MSHYRSLQNVKRSQEVQCALPEALQPQELWTHHQCTMRSTFLHSKCYLLCIICSQSSILSNFLCWKWHTPSHNDKLFLNLILTGLKLSFVLASLYGQTEQILEATTNFPCGTSFNGMTSHTASGSQTPKLTASSKVAASLSITIPLPSPFYCLPPVLQFSFSTLH